jgi:hypothetical protein
VNIVDLEKNCVVAFVKKLSENKKTIAYADGFFAGCFAADVVSASAGFVFFTSWGLVLPNEPIANLPLRVFLSPLPMIYFCFVLL